MSKTTDELKAEFQKSLSMLSTLRDEVRVQLHLAGQEAKDRWNKLEPELERIEKAAHEVTDASRAAVDSAIKSLRGLRDSLHKK